MRIFQKNRLFLNRLKSLTSFTIYLFRSNRMAGNTQTGILLLYIFYYYYFFFFKNLNRNRPFIFFYNILLHSFTTMLGYFFLLFVEVKNQQLYSLVFVTVPIVVVIKPNTNRDVHYNIFRISPI